MVATVPRRRPAIKVSTTIRPGSHMAKYIRDNYGSDPLMTGFAGVIDQMPGLFTLADQLREANITLEDYELVRWGADTVAEPRDMVRMTLTVNLIHKV